MYSSKDNDNNNNVITTYNGIEIYKSDIDILCNDYESQFINIDDITSKSVFFNGLLVYINRHLFKNITSLKYNNDYNALNDLFFDCFIPLCVKYNKTPTLQDFCSMAGISNSYLSDILSGTYRDGSKVNKNTYETVKKWKETTETALFNAGMAGNPVMAIFGLKAGYGWSDQQTQRLEITTGNENSTPEQLASKYGSIEKPAIDVID